MHRAAPVAHHSSHSPVARALAERIPWLRLAHEAHRAALKSHPSRVPHKSPVDRRILVGHVSFTLSHWSMELELGPQPERRRVRVRSRVSNVLTESD